MSLQTIDQRSDEWIESRVGKITASIAAACLGIHPYISRQKAWRTIIGKEIRDTNRYMEYGQRHEETARFAYERQTGHLVDETGFWLHDEFPWLGASPDGLVGEDGLLEIKCLSKMPTSVPAYYLLQCQIALAVTGRQWIDYVVWHPDHERLFIRRIYPRSHPYIIRRLAIFLDQYIHGDREPERKKPKPKAKKKKTIDTGAECV